MKKLLFLMVFAAIVFGTLYYVPELATDNPVDQWYTMIGLFCILALLVAGALEKMFSPLG